MKLSSLIWLAGLTYARPNKLAPRQSSANPPLSTNLAQALYFMTNDPSGNVIHAVPVDFQGQLSLGQGKSYATGGNGGYQAAPAAKDPGPIAPHDPPTQDPPPQQDIKRRTTVAPAQVADALKSQGSVTVAGNKLYVVNAGSNTLTLFNISCTDPTVLHQMGPTQSTLGNFPVSVAASSVVDTACVLNGGSSAGVACYGLNITGLVPLDKTQRSLTLPPNTYGTASQALFNNDLSELLAVVKGNSSGYGGYIASYSVADTGQVMTSATKSTPASSYIMSAALSISATMLSVVDSMTGGLFLADNHGSYTTSSTLSGYGTSYRWIAQSPLYTNLVYSSSGSANTIGSVDLNSGNSWAHSVGFPVANTGELVAAGKYLYSLSWGNTTVSPYIVVMQTNSDGSLTDIQSFGLTGVNRTVQGLAAFIPGEVDTQCTPDVPV